MLRIRQYARELVYKTTPRALMLTKCQNTLLKYGQA